MSAFLPSRHDHAHFLSLYRSPIRIATDQPGRAITVGLDPIAIIVAP
jgi:hypothetical protein